MTHTQLIALSALPNTIPPPIPEPQLPRALSRPPPLSPFRVRSTGGRDTRALSPAHPHSLLFACAPPSSVTQERAHICSRLRDGTDQGL